MPVSIAPPNTSAAKAIVFIHLSDIHFSKPQSGGIVYSPDDDIRHELKSDARSVLDREGLERAHFILVTGDIAFAGAREEYARADAWLQELCVKVQCPEQDVRTIPGNHDVQRAVIAESQSLQDAHALLRRAAAGEIDPMIGRYYGDQGAPNLLFRAIEHYNEFAAKFGCVVDGQTPFWNQDVMLNDGSILRVRGLNSALISDKLDNQDASKLVVGSSACLLKKEEGVEYLVMCHHPPSWLRDGEEIQSKLDSRARISLFGHQHVQHALNVTTAAGHESLRLHAGAVNPEAGAADYRPRYNVLAVSVSQRGEDRVLQVAVHRRLWDAAEQVFAGVTDAGGGPCQTFELKLAAWNPPNAAEAVLPPPAITQEPLQSLSDPLKIMRDDPNRFRMNASRRLAYRFLALPYHKRMQVAQQLALLRDEDQNVSDPELSRRFFQRAKESEKLAEFWRQVEEKHGAAATEINPFLST